MWGFQHADTQILTYLCRSNPSITVNLSTPYLDLWLGGVGVALDLKYVAHELRYDWDGEAFRLKNQSAQDTRRREAREALATLAQETERGRDYRKGN